MPVLVWTDKLVRLQVQEPSFGWGNCSKTSQQNKQSYSTA